MRRTLVSLLALIVGLPSAAPASRPAPPGRPFRFVVLGHVRGNGSGLNPKLAEVLEEVRRTGPDCLVLTGDLVWGDYNSKRTDSLSVEEEWRQLDSALATVGVPVLRVPGNHDINDGVTRDIWVRRYGTLPQAVAVQGHRFLLLSSAWIPQPGDTGKALYIRGRDLDTAQLGFLRRELSRGGSEGRTFVLLHHLLWWEPDTARWWREVHPLLAAARTAAVFSGDYGPMKFSTMERDGVHYFQTSIEDTVPVVMQRNRMASRLLSSQFDNFLVVTVRDTSVSVEVKTVAAESSGQFSPARWREINEVPTGGARPSRWSQIWELIGSPRRLAALGLGLLVVFLAGVLWGRLGPRGKPAPRP